MTAQHLQQRGVWEVPALEIARRAHRHRVGPMQTVAIFEAHLRHVRATTYRKPDHEIMAMVVSRMKAWPLQPVPEVQALSPRQRGFMTELSSDPDRPEATSPTSDPGRAVDDSAGLEEVDDDPLELLGISEADEALWQQVLGDLQLQVTRATFTTWIQDTWLKRDGQSYTIYAATPHAVGWLENRMHRLISQTLERHTGATMTISYTSVEM